MASDLEGFVGSYRSRNATYRAHQVLDLAAEIEARARSSLAAPHELPPSFVLRRDTPLETQIDHLRLTSLGARVACDDEASSVRLLFGNPDTGDVLVMSRSYPRDGALPPLEAELRSKRVSGATLQALATAMSSRSRPYGERTMSSC